MCLFSDLLLVVVDEVYHANRSSPQIYIELPVMFFCTVFLVKIPTSHSQGPAGFIQPVDPLWLHMHHLPLAFNTAVGGD